MDNLIAESYRVASEMNPILNPIDMSSSKMPEPQTPKLLQKASGKVIPGASGQMVITSDGLHVFIPQLIGSTTKVEPLEGGKYKVTTKPSVYNAKPKVEILTENELVEKFNHKKKTGKNLNVGV